MRRIETEEAPAGLRHKTLAESAIEFDTTFLQQPSSRHLENDDCHRNTRIVSQIWVCSIRITESVAVYSRETTFPTTSSTAIPANRMQKKGL